MRVRVMTYNIHRAIGLDRRFRPERTARIIATYDPVLLLLQEVDDGVPRSREMDLARELARSLGYPHVAVGHNVTLRKGRYGNATLSRHPILRERNIDLTIGERKRRGCQHTSLLVDSRTRHSHPLEVFNLHLGLSARERGQQLELLTRSREFASMTPEVACIVGGDFNDWRSLLLPFFTSRRFRCVTERSATGDAGIATYPAFFPRGTLDRIWHRGPLRLSSARRCRLRLARIASDHLPVVADLELH
jgi:endonuclease/exonuclease/phosphatase family metal-dependent hydrolase